MVFLPSCSPDLQSSEEGDGPVSGDDTVIEEFDKDRVIVVGTDPTYPPFEFLENGDIVGFDIEIAEQVFAMMEMEYELEAISWDPEFRSIIEGEIDVLISAVPYMEEKEKVVDFSIPYYTLEFLFITLLDSEVTIKEDLIGKKIGMLDITEEALSEEYLDDYQYSVYTEVSEMVNDLKEKGIDGFLLSVPLATVFLKENIGQFKILEKIKSQKDFVMVLEKASPLKEDIDTAIEELKKEQVYQEIYDEWMNSYF